MGHNAKTALVSMAEKAARERANPDRLLGDVLAKGYESRARAMVAKPKNGNGIWSVTHLDDILEEIISNLLEETYSFKVFAPNSYNFGIIVTYRQEWKPISYQVGELVSTIPLAPKEIRKFSKRTLVKKKRSVKEIEESVRALKEESSNTARADAEIVKEATMKSNFNYGAQGGVSVGVANFGSSASLAIEKGNRSQQTKKDFRESVVKSAQEYKQNRKQEISTEVSEEVEETYSGEISNPNDELPVTYMFYELQRRYEITEKIHKITPVILVANAVPAPHQINYDWLMRYDWILRRAILDDSFLPAFDYLLTREGDEKALEPLKESMDRQASVVEELTQQIEIKKREFEESIEKIFEKYFEISEPIVGTKDAKEFARAIANRERERLLPEFRKEISEMKDAMSKQVTALEAATERYVQALSEHLDRLAEIDRLRQHVKDNILYYMQAIWNHEHPDQRYFRIYNLDIFWPESATSQQAAVKDVKTIPEAFGLPGVAANMFPDKSAVVLEVPPPDAGAARTRKLYEVADLDNLLGYKGNYMIFPLRENSYLTTYMMLDYVDEVVGLRDPDDFGNYTIDDLLEIVECVKRRNPAGLSDNAKKELAEALKERLGSPRKDKEEIVVPTDSLYIEALPGRHPVLEDFKLAHRALDVKKTEAEATRAKLENIRLIARLKAKQYEDPDIEKKIVVEGNSQNVVVSHGEES
jgi:hypothetical protein